MFYDYEPYYFYTKKWCTVAHLYRLRSSITKCVTTIVRSSHHLHRSRLCRRRSLRRSSSGRENSAIEPFRLAVVSDAPFAITAVPYARAYTPGGLKIDKKKTSISKKKKNVYVRIKPATGAQVYRCRVFVN